MLNLSLNDLLSYTDWEREKWHAWLLERGDQILRIKIGEHGDGRFQILGDLVRHIFSAEKRYVERLFGRPLTDTSTVSTEKIDEIFCFGAESRRQLREFIATFPHDQWDVSQKFKIVNSSISATPRKIIMHVVLHEVRHWAQVATFLRLNGLPGDFHDFLFSPVMGGEIKHEQTKA
jgi:uncharacterized damage-inducible protein DinB